MTDQELADKIRPAIEEFHSGNSEIRSVMLVVKDKECWRSTSARNTRRFASAT